MNQTTMRPSFVLRGQRFFRRDLLYLAAFYLGIPTALALFAGSAESGSFSFVEKRYFYYYFMAATLPAWWAKDICTRLAKAVLRPWNPPLLLVLILGSILGQNLAALWAPLRHALFTPYLAEGSRFFPIFPWRYGEADYMAEAVIAWITGGVIWVAANLFYLYFLSYPRYGYRARPFAIGPGPQQESAAAASAPSVPGRSVLLSKLPEAIGSEIVALKAEEHYTRVYTTLGEALILMRFKDAVGLLNEPGGMQTHRSYWANAGFVEELVREGRSTHLHLTTGLDIPVSRSFRVKVEEAIEAHAV